MISLLVILINQSFQKQNIRYTFSDIEDISTNPEIDDLVTVEWQKLMVKTIQKGGKLWDDEIYRIRSVLAHGNKLQVDMSKVRYSHIKAIRSLRNQLYFLGDNYFAKSGIVSSIIKTSDSKYVVGVLAEGETYIDGIDMIERGYGDIIPKLQGIGIDITVVEKL